MTPKLSFYVCGVASSNQHSFQDLRTRACKDKNHGPNDIGNPRSHSSSSQWIISLHLPKVARWPPFTISKVLFTNILLIVKGNHVGFTRILITFLQLAFTYILRNTWPQQFVPFILSELVLPSCTLFTFYFYHKCSNMKDYVPVISVTWFVMKR